MSVCFQGAAAYPENEDQQQRLREAAEGLRVATNAAAQNAIKKKLINRLEVSEAWDHLHIRDESFFFLFHFMLFADMWPVDNSVHLSICQNAAKQAAAAATQTIAAAQNAAASNKNTAAHQQLVQSCKVRQPGG